jgi:hypothetical protein
MKHDSPTESSHAFFPRLVQNGLRPQRCHPNRRLDRVGIEPWNSVVQVEYGTATNKEHAHDATENASDRLRTDHPSRKCVRSFDVFTRVGSRGFCIDRVRGSFHRHLRWLFHRKYSRSTCAGFTCVSSGKRVEKGQTILSWWTFDCLCWTLVPAVSARHSMARRAPRLASAFHED